MLKALEGITRVHQFETTPEAKVQGALMKTWLENQLAEETKPLLTKRGIDEIDPETWYPHQLALDIMRELTQGESNLSMTLVAVGKQVVEYLPVDEFATIDDFKTFVGSLHQASGQDFPAHEKHLLVEEDGELYLINNTPTSNDLVFGVFWEILRRCKIGGVYYKLIPYADYPSNEVGSVFRLDAR